jgi:formamidopyrimidine-DNA glycosylase
MPELPDLAVYQRALENHVVGQTLNRVELLQPFTLRTAVPPMEILMGRRLLGVGRIGKRLVLDFGDAHHLLIHLMVAGRFKYLPPEKKSAGRGTLFVMAFERGNLLLTEAGTKRRATLHVVQGQDALKEFDRGGVELFEVDLSTFREKLEAERHTLKRALTDPRMVSGVGNAYSDEILHAAGLSPFKMTDTLSDAEWARLFDCARDQLRLWSEKLLAAAEGDFPAKVTAFVPEMAVHGRYREACPVCQAPIQRIVHGKRETNYCPGCQTGGRIYADRALSRLLKKDWPRTLEELENHPLGKAARGKPG